MTHQSIDEGILLPNSPALSRLHRNLEDLIIAAFERFTKVHSKSPYLSRLEHVYDENEGEKFYMHFAAQVKDQKQDATTTIRLTFAVSKEDEWLENP